MLLIKAINIRAEQVQRNQMDRKMFTTNQQTAADGGWRRADRCAYYNIQTVGREKIKIKIKKMRNYNKKS